MPEGRRRLAVLTTGRQDYAILRSTLLALRDDARFVTVALAGGMHLDPRHGLTVREIEADGLRIERVGPEGFGSSSDPSALFGPVAEALPRLGIDALFLVGDRSEVAFAALAGTLARAPIIHLHGGEESEGALDNALRHAITKLSHLHLVSHELHARRVRQMGEPEASVHVVGAPGLDNLLRDDPPARQELERSLGLRLEPPVVLVTYHPTTLGGDPSLEADALLEAMDQVNATWVITLPNADVGAEPIRERLSAFARTQPRARAVEALGARLYVGALRASDAMLGNSSSALIEGPCLGIPAVNVGDRQKGRLRGANVLDVPARGDEITAALERALRSDFKRALEGSVSPYGDGHSAPRIVEILAHWDPARPPRKPFVDRTVG